MTNCDRDSWLQDNLIPLAQIGGGLMLVVFNVALWIGGEAGYPGLLKVQEKLDKALLGVGSGVAVMLLGSNALQQAERDRKNRRELEKQTFGIAKTVEQNALIIEQGKEVASVLAEKKP